MRLISKLVAIWIVILAVLWTLVLAYEHIGFDNLGKPRARLSAATAVEPARVSSGKVLRSTGERYEIDYPQAVDKSSNLWITLKSVKTKTSTSKLLEPSNSKQTLKTLKTETPKRLVTRRASSRGYNSNQLKCLFELIDRESSWNHKADNPTSSAYGLFQQLKLDPDSSVQKQVRLGLTYIEHRYGTPCAALKHHNRKGWY